MTRYFHSQRCFEKYRPDKPRRFWGFWRRKKKRVIAPSAAKSAINYGHNLYKKPQKRRSIKLWILILFIVLSGWVTLVGRLPYFKIKEAFYNGLNIIKKEEISAVVAEYLNRGKIFPHDSYFFFRTGGLEKIIQEKYSLSKLEIEKQFPNVLMIRIEEKISSIIYDNGRDYFLLDGDGTAIKYLGKVDELLPAAVANASTTTSTRKEAFHTPDYRKLRRECGAYPIVFDLNNSTTTEKQTNVFPKELIAKIINWQERLEGESMVKPRYFVYTGPFAEVMVSTQEGFDIYFSLQTDFESQLLALKAVLQKNNPKEYVKILSPQRVYWK